jgi:basic membrane protein A
VYYLSGIIAATVNTETSENFFVVSELNEDAYRNINAFTLGVRKYKKNGIVKVIVLKSKNENIQYSQLIEAQKRNPDARIMTADYTDITVDDFCEQKMYYCIRYDKDFANKYFLSNIASVQVDYRGFFSRVLSRTVTNSFESGNYLLDVSTGTVRITNFNEGIIPPNTMQLLDLALYRFMIANNDNIFSGPLYDNEHRLRLDKGYSLQDEPNDIFSMDWFVEGAVLEHL